MCSSDTTDNNLRRPRKPMSHRAPRDGLRGMIWSRRGIWVRDCGDVCRERAGGRCRTSCCKASISNAKTNYTFMYVSIHLHLKQKDPLHFQKVDVILIFWRQNN